LLKFSVTAVVVTALAISPALAQTAVVTGPNLGAPVKQPNPHSNNASQAHKKSWLQGGLPTDSLVNKVAPPSHATTMTSGNTVVRSGG
jgi:hypothetical protein